jgi:hypothetical protein
MGDYVAVIMAKAFILIAFVLGMTGLVMDMYNGLL